MAAVPGITVSLQGGLGNQLFIYAAGLSTATRLQCPLYLDTRWFESSRDRRYALKQFQHSGIELGRASRTADRLPHKMLSARRAISRSLTPLRHSVKGTFCERGFDFDESILSVGPGTQLSGDFQSWKYFSDVAFALRHQITWVREPSAWFEEKLKYLAKRPRWIAMHIRRGDYLRSGTAEYHGVIGADYYARSLRLVRRLIGDAPLVVFSDEPDSAEALIAHELRGGEIVVPPTESSELESLLLMSGGHGLVIANSSFSWWAAWLRDALDRPVVAPRPWFAGATHRTDDLLPAHWMTLGA